MTRNIRDIFIHTALVMSLILLNCHAAAAQTTAFTYQGKLTDAGNPANGNYDLQFKLFDALASGNQVGSTSVREDIAVSNGVFTVTLDFGAAAFPGANRFLEIGVRPGTSTGAFTVLSPLQPISSTPYAVQSLNAANATNASNFSGALAGDVTGTQSATVLANNAVTTVKLANGSVTDGKIADVAGGKITGLITSATLPGANITGAVASATNAVNATNAVSATNALNAVTAVNFSGSLVGDVTGTQGATTVTRLQGRMVASSTPLGGQVLKFNSTTNQWEPDTDNTSAGGGGTITGVTPGTGLSGGGASGNVTLNIANSGVNTAQLADNSVTDAKINSVSGGKVTGAVANATNAVNATNATNATTAVNATNATNATNAVNFSGALGGDVTGTQAATTVTRLRNVTLPAPVVADNGKVLKYKNNGVDPISFEWATDNTAAGGGVTSVTASAPLASSGGATPNLSLTGIIQPANGGTGLSAAGVVGNYLRSNGTVWTSSALQATDVPDLGATYLKNTTTLQPNSNFNISGNGLIGGNLGIGTITPQQKLHVDGNEIFSTGNLAGFKFRNRGSTTNADNWVWYSQDNIARLFRENVGDLLAITTSGNVGIGNSNPGSITKLDVQGGSLSVGVFGSASATGVNGNSPNGTGVFGNSFGGYAGYFEGKVRVTGVLEKPGGGFKIDHPLDPENKYLVHSFVESPEMKNLYDGSVTTDAQGEAVITLPDWFAALNRDFRYQLTCIGVFAQAIIAEKIKDNRFKIKTSLANVEVSWQVTGTRQDAWANQNRLSVEEPKSALERGSYQNPTAFGQPEERSIEWARQPEMMRRMKDERERWQREQNTKAAVPVALPHN